MRFSDRLINWYQEHKRDLPWRKTNNPYAIWLSEIILQQTRVDQGLNYYYKFIEHFPTVQDLARADQQEVLNLWQGLGYYSRARNMHEAAKVIVSIHQGIFPNEYNQIRSLKGVGEYTAAAISSFAFKQPYPVIDGNVYRVLARIFGIEEAIDSAIGKKTFNALASELMNQEKPDLHNQAIMEFGALQCTPKQPKCDSCPFRLDCFALKNDRLKDLPFKSKKTKVRHRFFNYLVMKDEEGIVINERKSKDIWKGLFDFPLIESTKQLNSKNDLKNHIQQQLNVPTEFKIDLVSNEHIHLLSHQKIHAKFWRLDWPEFNANKHNCIKIGTKEINNYPVPKLIENYIKATF